MNVSHLTAIEGDVPLGLRVTACGRLEWMLASEVHAATARALNQALRQLRPLDHNAVGTRSDKGIIADLHRTNERLLKRIAELEGPAPEWKPLKAAAFECGLEYERLRKKVVQGQVEARRIGGRWLVNVLSLKLRMMRGLVR